LLNVFEPETVTEPNMVVDWDAESTVKREPIVIGSGDAPTMFAID
jgi:hypothetical protein